MPRAVLASLALASLLGAAPAARANEAAVATELQPGQSRSVRIRNVPAGAMVAVRIVSSGPLLVAVVGMKQLKESQPKAVFRGTVRRTLSFRVTLPANDDYLLVLNNRRGTETLSVEAEIRAVRGGAAPAPDGRPPPERYSPRPEKASWSPR